MVLSDVDRPVGTAYAADVVTEPRPPLRTRDLLYGEKLGVPWVTLLLVVTCFMVTLPLYFDPRRFYLTLGVSYCEEDGLVHWWHYIVSHFVHGTGCPFPAFPPIGFHIGINVVLFVFQGMLVERVLGSGRTALVTFTSLAVQIVLMHILIAGRGHGASGMTWSYLLFSWQWLAWTWKRVRWQMLKDWVTCVLALLSVLAVVGLIKHWHLWNLLVSLPFFLVWRKTFAANVESVARGEPLALDRGKRGWNAAGIGVAAAVWAFCAYFVLAAVLGWLKPVALGAAPPS